MRKWFFLLLVLTACSSSSSYEPINYFTGSEGLTMRIESNNPPEQVYAGQQFPVTIFIENVGAWDVMDEFHGQATVSYDDLYLFETEDAKWQVERSKVINIFGKSPEWPTGQSYFSTIGLLTPRDLGPRTGAATPVLISLCYPYQTTFVDTVCIGSEFDDRVQSCTVQKDMSYDDQGAPIAITSVSFDPTPAGFREYDVTSTTPTDGEFGLGEETATERVPIIRPVFRISIQNVGRGQLVQARGFDEQKLCALDPNDVASAGAVTVRAQLGNSRLTCFPQNPDNASEAIAPMIDGLAEVVCMVPDDELVEVLTTYEEFIKVEAAYTYRLRESVSVEIIDSLKDIDATPVEFVCGDFNRQEHRCKTYTGTPHSCAWCPSKEACVEQSNCNDCGGLGYLEDDRECQECPSVAPKITVQKTASDTRVEITCEDPFDQGSYVDHGTCGCNKIMYAFTEQIGFCPANEDDYIEISGTYADHKTTAEVFIEDGFNYLCARVFTPGNEDGSSAGIIL